MDDFAYFYRLGGFGSRSAPQVARGSGSLESNKFFRSAPVYSGWPARAVYLCDCAVKPLDLDRTRRPGLAPGSALTRAAARPANTIFPVA